MTVTRSALDAGLLVVAALAWSFAVFAFGARWISPLASGMLALAILLSASATALSMHLRDRRLLALSAGRCPRCGSPLAPDHRHRRWQAVRAIWEPPATAWDCGACGFSHSEPWACPVCPEP